MSPINMILLILFLTSTLETAISKDVNNNDNRQIEYTKRSSHEQSLLEYTKGKKKKRTQKTKEFSTQVRGWSQDCGCLKGTKILTVKKLPIKCACMFHDYDKERAPGEGESITTVMNTFKRIRILNVKEAEKKILADIKLSSQWEDARIRITFPNNESKILITKYSPQNSLFPIWMAPRSLKGRFSNDKWKFYFLNSFSGDETLVEMRASGHLEFPCNFNFTNFPFDLNHCSVPLTRESSGEIKEFLDPKNKKIEYFESTVFSAFDVSIKLYEETINDTNEFSSDFGFNIAIERRISSYVLQYYLPCASIVFVSSISFIIPLTAIPGRISLVVTLFLTLVNLIIENEVRFVGGKMKKVL